MSFEGLAQLVERESGIVVPPQRQGFWQVRLARLLQARPPAHLAQRADGDEHTRREVVEAVCTHETRLFRDVTPFTAVADELAPVWRAGGQRPVRVWSAGCSSGEETYSLAALAHLALPGWPLEVVGSDISATVLDQARMARWPAARAVEIPARWRDAFETDSLGQLRPRAAVRARVRFQRHNLTGRDAPPDGQFDLIACRNVLIYFRPEVRARVLGRLVASLAPGGWLLVGLSEGLGATTALERVADGAYRVRGGR